MYNDWEHAEYRDCFNGACLGNCSCLEKEAGDFQDSYVEENMPGEHKADETFCKMNCHELDFSYMGKELRGLGGVAQFEKVDGIGSTVVYVNEMEEMLYGAGIFPF